MWELITFVAVGAVVVAYLIIEILVLAGVPPLSFEDLKGKTPSPFVELGDGSEKLLRQLSRELAESGLSVGPDRLRLWCTRDLSAPGSLLRSEEDLAVFRVVGSVGSRSIPLDVAIDREGALQWIRRSEHAPH